MGRMSIDVDERRCPNCGHGVISWEVVCPGCDRVPWESPAGRRILRRRRWWFALLEESPVTILIILVARLTLFGVLIRLRWIRV